LEYRLKHFEEITGMMEPPGLASKSEGTISGGAVPNTTAEEDVAKKVDRNVVTSSATSIDNVKMKDL
jgi:hypothetical protein